MWQAWAYGLRDGAAGLRLVAALHWDTVLAAGATLVALATAAAVARLAGLI